MQCFVGSSSLCMIGFWIADVNCMGQPKSLMPMQRQLSAESRIMESQGNRTLQGASNQADATRCHE